jgi:drug/metabolite transporter (DMT)-like permease
MPLGIGPCAPAPTENSRMDHMRLHATSVPAAAHDIPVSAAYLLLALAVLCWAGNFVIGRGLRFDAPPVALTFWRWTLAFVVLAPFSYRHWRRQWPVIRRRWKIITLLALFATVLQHIPIYWGLSQTSATNGALLNATSPVFIVLLSVLLLHERLAPIAILGSLVSLTGVAMIVSRGDPQTIFGLRLNAGDIGVLVGTLGWAAYTVCLRWRPPELRGLDLLGLIAGVSVAMLAPLYVLEMAAGRTMQVNGPTLTGIAYVGIVASVLAYMGWNRGVAKVGPARAAPFMYLMLLFTPLLAIVFLGERLQFYHFAGAGLIISGIYLATATRTKRA